MAVTKTTTTEGTGASPVKGQTVTIEYTGYLKDTSKPGNKGASYVPPFPLSPSPSQCLSRELSNNPIPLTQTDRLLDSTPQSANPTSALKSASAASSAAGTRASSP
jgi:hypothetical protein